METKKKLGTLAVAASIPNEKNEPKNLKLVNTDNIEEAKIIQNKPIGKNLDETIKIIEDLHRKKRHRDRLDTYCNYLAAFDIEKKAEELDPKSNYYTGCKLSLSDDKSAQFELKNPTLICEVVEFLKTRLGVKLGEIEAELVLPL